LVNVSGFHVDPGYHGQLTFAVFNAGPVPIHLKRGQPIFLIWYASLDRETAVKKDGVVHLGIDAELITAVALALMIAPTVNWLKDGFPSRPQVPITPRSAPAP
jgi:dCTP deaminase